MARSSDGQGVAIRLSLRDGEVVRRALQQLGREGQQALRALNKAAASADAEKKNKALASSFRNVASSVAILHGPLGGIASRFSALGTIVGRLGPVAAGAAIGLSGLSLATAAAFRTAREGLREFDALGKRIRTSGLSNDFYQGLQFGAMEASIDQERFNKAMERFTGVLGEARQGRGEFVEALRKSHPELVREVQQAANADQAIRRLADAVSRAQTADEKALITKAAFGSRMIELVRVLDLGSDGMDRTTQRARELGLVIDKDLLTRAEDLENQMGIASKVIDLNLKTAFIGLAPTILAVTSALGTAARALSDFIEDFRDFENRSTQGLVRRLGEINAQLKDLRDDWFDSTVSWVTGAEARLEKEAAQIRAVLEARRAAREEEERAKSASGAGGRRREQTDVQRTIAALEKEIETLRTLDPVQREMIGLSEQLKAAKDDEIAQVEDLIRTRIKEKEAADAAADAQRTFAMVLGDVFSSLNGDGEKTLDVLRRITLQLVQAEIQARALGKAGALGNVFGTVFGGIGDPRNVAFSTTVTPAVLHGGLYPGAPAPRMRVDDAAAWRGAPRLHDGLMPGEFRAILQQGEQVIPRGRSAGGPVVQPVFQIDARGAQKGVDQDIMARMRAEFPAMFMDAYREAQSRRAI